MNKQNAALLSIVSNSLLIIFKLVAGILIGSISVISEAIHSSMDLLASLIAYFSIKKAAEAEDDEHPFGHGKFENISGLIESILIFFAGAIIIFEAIKRIIMGGVIDNVVPGLIVMLISALVNTLISLKLLKISKETKSIALETDAMHLLTDVYTALGVFGGLFLVKITGFQILDPLSAIIVAVMIIKTSLELIERSSRDLVDRSLSPEDVEKIKVLVLGHKEIQGCHRLRTRKSGHREEIDVHIDFMEDYSLLRVHNICDEIENEIKKLFPQSYVLIHAEPIKSKVP
ncbi:MAG: cation diffusion facilitator family transporter [Solirubrobacterales bacterium]